MKYQVMPELTAEEYAELKEDISRRGVMVPIEYDELGNVLDGYHRLKICGELGIKEFPKVIRAGMTEAEKLTHARKLNMARRQLTGDQKRELIRDQLKATPEHSDRQIARALGVNHETVGTQRKNMEATGEIRQFEKSIGKDGKERPRQTTRKQQTIPQETAEQENNSHNGQELRLCAEHTEPTEPVIQKPVTVFNPTKREITAMKNPEVIARMQATGTNAVNAEKQINRESKAERKAYELQDDIPEGMLRLFAADIRDGLKDIESGSVDAIITDPPYGREYIPLYGALSEIASRVLKPNGSLIVMIGQSYRLRGREVPEEVLAGMKVEI